MNLNAKYNSAIVHNKLVAEDAWTDEVVHQQDPMLIKSIGHPLYAQIVHVPNI